MRALLPSLALLACPLGMGAMMYMMTRRGKANPDEASSARDRRIAELEAEVARRQSDPPIERLHNS
ncbi:MAG: hypothetical protein ABIM89_13400 [Mycobacteriales bacterium]